MRPIALICARAVVLAGPTVLAFFSGGFFDEPRVWAGLVAWALVAIAALVAPRPFPRVASARLVLAGLALLLAWTALSTRWAPLKGPAYDDVQRLGLYLGALVAAVALLRGRRTARAAEAATAIGALVVVGYGLSERLLPGLIEFARSPSAGGRLDQPLTYWNAMGLVAALGLVLCARLAGDPERHDRARVLAAAAAAPLGLGLYISFSRGGLLAYAAGLAVLIAAAPSWPTLRGVALTLQAAALGAVVSAPFDGVTALAGDLGQRKAEGTTVLVVLALIVLGAAAVQARLCGGERELRLRMEPLGLPRRTPLIAVACVLAGLVLFVAVAARDRGPAPTAAGAARLGSVQSNRYAYWRVAGRSWADHPLRGVGAGGFRVEWLRERPFREPAQDAHSL
ncbi:MAG: hypothetical protein ACR2NH_03175 [Solirubrobacteraceae bacterium]